MKLIRTKNKNLLLTITYRLSKLIFLKPSVKLKLFLDLEWIFNRLAHEESFKFYTDNNHPIRTNTYMYILNYIKNTDRVVDIGCKYGEIANFIAEKAKEVIAIDNDADAINIAKNRYQKQNLRFICDEAYHFLESQNEIFDILVLSHFLEHLENPEAFLNTYKKFFNLIYIEIPDFDNSFLNQYRKDVKTNLIYSDTDHIYEFDRNEILEIINNCDLKIINSEYRFGVQRIWCKTNEF